MMGGSETRVLAGGRYRLDARTLAQHRGGRVVALAVEALGSHHTATAELAKPARKALSGQARIPGSRAISTLSVVGPLMQRSEPYCGWIMGYDTIAQSIVGELNDPEVSAVVVRIDSPGGDVAGLEECVRVIREARDASRKPVSVYVDEMAASAAYWLAAGIASEGMLCAPIAAQIGSIGCYTVLADETQSLAQEGVSIQLVRDPPGKDAANPTHPITEVALARAQALVAADATRFYDAIAEYRGLKPDAVRTLNAAVFLAEEALAAGLIDSIGTIENAETNAIDSPFARRARSTNSRSAMSTKAAEMPAQPEESSGGRATASQVASSCEACATGCADCAEACTSGTADEAISSATACMALCQKNIEVISSFLGGAPPKGEPKPEPKAEPKPDVPPAVVGALGLSDSASAAEVISAIGAVSAELAQLRAYRAEADDTERRALVGQLVRCGAELPATAWEDRAGAVPVARLRSEPLDGLRARVAVLTAGKGLASVEPPTGAAAGLSENELRICKDTGCDPERFAALKARREGKA